ncbi:MAG TPA: glycosyltransferase family 4 protein [Acidimicrobiales bacterium]|jgi:phosphatidylinositol alpha-1,6-mannosyltransferase|nr:glycosyltransferase family 4 protein [Acidimicrobiales bacterium]
MTRHLLVTNDFPPKHGGIQSYLWELWRRLPAPDVTVLTTAYPGARQWDATQPFRIERVKQKVLLPTPAVVRRVDALADEVDAAIVLLDPALPIGLIGPRLRHRYGLVVHGAEVTVPGRLPGSTRVLRHVLRAADLVVCAGRYAQAEAERAAGRTLPTVHVPPGVDVDRFRPLSADVRDATRARLGLPLDRPVVLGLSRLVPRKGFDTLLRATGQLAARHEFEVAIAGVGRDRARLGRVAVEAGAPAHFLGRVPDDELPAVVGSADVFAMLCRTRWLGLEQEGFGIVFLEAAAAGVPQLAGASGGASEAVIHGETGLVVDPPDDVDTAATALSELLSDGGRRSRLGASARARAVDEYAYDVLVRRLRAAIDGVGG